MQISYECYRGRQAVTGGTTYDRARFGASIVFALLQMRMAANMLIVTMCNLCLGLQPKKCALYLYLILKHPSVRRCALTFLLCFTFASKLAALTSVPAR